MKYFIITILIVAFLAGIIISDNKIERPPYIIRQTGGYAHYVYSYQEKDGCVIFENYKLCGNYSITNR